MDDSYIITNSGDVCIVLSAAILVTINFRFGRLENNFKPDRVVEDWAKNRLDLAQKYIETHPIVIETSDTGLFALYYVQNILKHHPEIPVIAPGLLPLSWYFDKVSKRLSSTMKLDREKFVGLRTIDMWENLVDPNIENFSFNIPSTLESPRNVHTKHMFIGKMVTKGKGNSFDLEKLKLNHGTEVIYPYRLKYSTSRRILARYSYFPQQYAVYLNKEGKLDEAIEWLKYTLEIFPYAWPSAENLCKLKVKDDFYCNELSFLRSFPNYY